MSQKLRAELSRRLRMESPPEWGHFSQLWMAFNAMYGGEPEGLERSRVMRILRVRLSEARSRAILRQCSVAADRILRVPPGDMLFEQWNPKFRRRSRELARAYRKGASSNAKLVALGGILYQVRCNLVHGSKDPREERDRMLVRESTRVLEIMLPELEAAINSE